MSSQSLTWKRAFFTIGMMVVLTIGVVVLAVRLRHQVQHRRHKTAHGKDIDCVISKAAQHNLAKTDCIPHCKGISRQIAYEITQFPKNNGKKCSQNDILQSQKCHVEHGAQCNQDCIPGKPKPGSWSACPHCIPSGQTKAQRLQVVPPQQEQRGNGTPCDWEDILQAKPCPTGNGGDSIPPCDVQKKNCIPSDKPKYVSHCSNPCGKGRQFVVYGIKQHAKHGGRSCNPVELAHYRTCHGNPQSTACKNSHQGNRMHKQKCDSITNWPDTWTECDRPCGGGQQYQTRQPLTVDDDCPTVRSRPCNTQCCS
jgi:hypothetical protein